MSEFRDFHFSPLFVAFSGTKFTASCIFPPSSTVWFTSPETVISFTATSVTVTFTSALTPDPSDADAVILASPAFTAVSLPLSTCTTSPALDDHVTFLFVASSGLTTAFRVASSPVFKERLSTFLESCWISILVTSLFTTVTVKVSRWDFCPTIGIPVFQLCVIVAVPAFTPVTVALVSLFFFTVK